MQILGVLVLLASSPLLFVAQMELGNEVLAEHRFKELQGKRVGLITNPIRRQSQPGMRRTKYLLY